MRRAKVKLLIVFMFVGCLLTTGPVFADPYFLIDTNEQWEEANNVNVRPMTTLEWDEYMRHLGVPNYGTPDANTDREGEPYPENEFLPAELYVYEGNEANPEDPNDAGLVMAWGLEDPCNPTLPDGNYSSAWVYDFGEDPDIRHCIIKISVTPPSGCNINRVSFAIQDAAGRRRSWSWLTPGTIPYDVPTTVTIDTDKTGRGATIPRADGYASHNQFNMRQALFFDVDENANWIFGMQPVPPPGIVKFVGMWNYWHNLLVTKKPPSGKHFVKWSQPPQEYDPCDPDVFDGWDEESLYDVNTIVADDWLCEDERPVTDIHWWGSFIGWDQPNLPPILPIGFQIGIWTDVPDTNVNDPNTFSHPGTLIWANYCDNWVWNFAGYDRDPRKEDPNGFDEQESCFQFNQLLSQDQWFYQEPNDPCDNDPNSTVYWLSIAAVYNPGDHNYADPNFYPWGWKTRPHFFNDDAVWGGPDVADWPPVIGTQWAATSPIKLPPYPDPCGVSWDMAFELTTNEAPPDTNAPYIDPADEWVILPTEVATSVVTMTAKAAADDSGVEYYFDETTDNPGATDSGWQDSTGYTDWGLDPNTEYRYKYKARDKSPAQNETTYTPDVSVTTWQVSADLDGDDIVNFKDLNVLGDQWLTSGP